MKGDAAPPSASAPQAAIPAWRALLEARWGRTLGLALLLAGQLRYVSYASRPILGRWSVPAFAAICVVACLFASSLLASSRATRAARSRMPQEWIPALELGYLLLGVAYCAAALADRGAGGRLLELDLFGSYFAPSILIAWLAGCAFTAGLFGRAWSRWHARAPRALLVALSLAAALLLGEGITRLVCVAFPKTQGYPTTFTELWMRRYVERNHAGFRDRDHALAKPPGVRRIVLIGDSFTFAQGVERTRDRAGERLERLLDAQGAGPVEVINLGVPYTHTLQHLDTLAQGLAYQPDLILLLYVFNDIDYLQSTTRPTAIAVAPDSFLDRLNPLRILFANSLLYQQIHLRLRHLYWKLAFRESEPRSAYADPELVARHLEDLRSFVTRARAGGTSVVIVPFNPVFARSAEQDPQRAFVGAMLAAGFPVWPLEKIWEGVGYEELIVNAMDHHPNAHANELLARALAHRIAALWSAPARAGAGS